MIILGIQFSTLLCVIQAKSEAEAVAQSVFELRTYNHAYTSLCVRSVAEVSATETNAGL